MPYVAQEQRHLLEEDLTDLANEICDRYQSTKFRLLAYRYVCLRLGVEVLPQRRYAALSAVRAVYSDASFEWQRRWKVKPKKFICENVDFSILNEKINGAAKKITNIAAISKEPHLAWQGLFNYYITALGLKIEDRQNESISSLIAGVLEYLHDYFYEVEMIPYEDEQIIKNGDVF